MQIDLNVNFPLVSIVMCTYNGSYYIQEQIESLRNQTYPCIEIIIFDDCSTDDTYKLLEQFSSTDRRIRCYSNESNLGYTGNFSKACTYAIGEYIAISDQDDVWHPDKIKRLMEHWKPGVSLMYCNSVRFENEVPWNTSDNSLIRRFEGNDSRKLAIFNTISGHALIAKKTFIESQLPFPKKLMYDWWLGVVASCNGGVGYLPDILVFQRVHDNNASIIKNAKGKKKFFHEMVNDHLVAFASIPNMPAAHILFFKKLSILWSEALLKKFSPALFSFLMRHRIIIFWYKKRKIGMISQIKHSYILATN